MNKEERRKGGLDTLNRSAVILYSGQWNPKHELCQREKIKKRNYIELEMNTKKVNKSNIMYKINYSYSSFNFF